MPTLQDHANHTCSELLSATQLQKICEFRGWSPPSNKKDALAAFVAARLLGTTGVAQALASLTPEWLWVLHALAASSISEKPEPITTVAAALSAYRDGWHTDYRALFRDTCDNLLNRGLIVADDSEHQSAIGSKGARFEGIRLVLPAQFHSFLPPVPCQTLAIVGPASRGSPQDWARTLLQSAAIGKPPAVKRFADTLAAQITLTGGALEFGGKGFTELAAFTRWVYGAWLATELCSAPSQRRGCHGVHARHVLLHLPPQRGISAEALVAALAAMGKTAEIKVVAQFLADGYAAGLVGCSQVAGVGVYSDLKLPVWPAASAPHWRATATGVAVDWKKTSAAAVLRLALASSAEFAGGELLLRPELRRMGHQIGDAAVMATVDAAGAVQPLYAQMAALLRQRQGKVQVHTGLLVIRAADVGFRALLGREFGSHVVPLDGPYVAVPAGLEGAVEKLARKHGLTPRRSV